MAEQVTSQGTFWTAGRVVATAIVGLLIATFGYMMFSGHAELKTDARIVLPGTPVSSPPAPPDYNVPTLDGSAIKLSGYQGKVVVMDFWATWCPPCRQEVPQLARLQRENQARGLEVVGLHIDDRGRSTPEAIRRFINDFGINYTVGIANDEMFTAYLGTADDTIPQTLVFDRKGRLV
ncbi:MAG TPA: TlpA disulfide reductase family protein, partial [Blastocatellia bacterium]|nr:TlpA disulfide reductase family protein [Blastocatellia bacterium]